MATITYTVTVATGTNQYGTGNKYYINGTVSPDLNLIEGNTYIFDQSDSTNGTHRIGFSTTPNGSWGGGVEYTTGVTVTGSPGTDGKTTIVVATYAPTLYYYCVNHSGMGAAAYTPAAGSISSASKFESTFTIDEVIEDAPLFITEEYIEKHQIDKIAVPINRTKEEIEKMCIIPYKKNMLCFIDYTQKISTSIIINRIKSRTLHNLI